MDFSFENFQALSIKADDMNLKTKEKMVSFMPRDMKFKKKFIRKYLGKF